MRTGSTQGTATKSILGSIAALAALGAIAMARYQMGPEWLLNPIKDPRVVERSGPMVARSTMMLSDEGLDAERVRSVESRLPNLTEGLSAKDGLLEERHSIDAEGRLVATLYFETRKSAEKWFEGAAKKALGSLLKGQDFPELGRPVTGQIMVLLTLTPRKSAVGVLDSPVEAISMQVFQAKSPEFERRES